MGMGKVPGGKKWEGFSKIRDGLLIEFVWTTKRNYISNVKDLNYDWYISGSDKLLPVINQDYIEELNNYVISELEAKCMNQAVKNWDEVQESTTKVLNAIELKNVEGISLLASDMFLRMLKILSFINMTPFITFSSFISQAKKFERKPEDFNKLINIMIQGKYSDLLTLKNVVVDVFVQFESIFKEHGIDLYGGDLDRCFE